MNDDNIRRLRHEQGAINGAYGLWGTDELANGCSAGAAVPGFGGDPGSIYDIAANLTKVRQVADRAHETLRQVCQQGIGASWVGDTQVAASQAANSLVDPGGQTAQRLNPVVNVGEQYGQEVEQRTPLDNAAIDSLNDVAAQAARMTALGFLPDLSDFDSEAMSGLHHQGMEAIDSRVSAHSSVRAAGRDLAARLRDHADGARGRRMGGSPLSAVDEVVLAEAGNHWISSDTAILTPAQQERAAAALSRLNDADRRTMMDLLGSSASPEQRAYLMRMLAAGYPLGDVARFDSLIAAHGDDPQWLAQHLSPFAMDQPGSGLTDGKQWNAFGGELWVQGQNPTCVAASTVAARAAIDPLYALELTTGGHPGDPAFDNPGAFAERLRAEQADVYDDGRDWLQKLPIVGSDGMTDDQSATIANEQIATRTGASYANVEVGDANARYATLPQIEEAVDDGYPVPVFTRGDAGSHQMVIIGHLDGQLQIYNPWGYTYWVSEHEFTNGNIAAGEQGLPGSPVSVRLPREMN